MIYLSAAEAAKWPLSTLQDGQWLPQKRRVLKLNGQWLAVRAITYMRYKEMKVARIIKRPLKRETVAWLANWAQVLVIVTICFVLTALAGVAIVKGLQLTALALADKIAPVRQQQQPGLFEQRRATEAPTQREI